MRFPSLLLWALAVVLTPVGCAPAQQSGEVEPERHHDCCWNQAYETGDFLRMPFGLPPLLGDTISIFTPLQTYLFIAEADDSNLVHGHSYTGRCVGCSDSVQITRIDYTCACVCGVSVYWRDTVTHFGLYSAVPINTVRPYSFEDCWQVYRDRMEGVYTEHETGERLAISLAGDTVQVAYANRSGPFSPLATNSPNRARPNDVTVTFPGTRSRHLLQFRYDKSMSYYITCHNPDGSVQAFYRDW